MLIYRRALSQIVSQLALEANAPFQSIVDPTYHKMFSLFDNSAGERLVQGRT